MKNRKKAIVLLSGGLDSTTAAAIALSEGYDLYALSFRYGQRHQAEIKAAKRAAAFFSVKQHIVADIDLRMFGGSALTADIKVPKGRTLAKIGEGIPITYVPARNTIFLSFALGWAEVLPSTDIFIGVNALDCSGYPDCRPVFIDAFEALANVATRIGMEKKGKICIHAPLMRMTKAEIIRRGIELKVDYSLTSTCYDPDSRGKACGACDACLLRLKGFSENGLADPISYQKAKLTRK